MIANGTLSARSQTVEPLANYSVVARAPRVRQPVVARLHGDGDESQPGRRYTRSCRTMPTRRPRLGPPAVSRRYAIHGLLGGQRMRGAAPRRSRACRRATSTAFSVRTPTTSSYDPARTALNGDGGSIAFGKIAGANGRFNSQRRLQEPGFDINDLRLHAPRRRAVHEQLVPVAQRQAGEVRAQLPLQPQPVGGLELRRRPAVTGRQRQRALGVHEQLEHRRGFNIDAAPFDDRVTRGGPGVLGNPGSELVGLRRTPTIARPSSFHLQRRLRRRPANGIALTSFNPGVNVPADLVRCRSASASASASTTTTRSGSRTRRRRPATCSAASIRRRCRSTRRVNYTMTPDAVDPGLRASRSCRPATTPTSRSSWTAARASYERSLRADAYEGNPDFNYRSFRTTNVLRWEYKPGSALFVVWQQGARTSCDSGDFRVRPRLRRRLLGAGATTCSS